LHQGLHVPPGRQASPSGILVIIEIRIVESDVVLIVIIEVVIVIIVEIIVVV
jgi:hypothetical protein